MGWAADSARAEASFNAIQLISAHLIRAGYLDTPANATASSSSSSSFSATDGAPGDLPAYKSALIEDLEEAMRDVVDPELGINVVDLGLVYGIQAENGVATIDMTLTSAACPLTDVIEEQARAALTGGAGLVEDIKINWVWMPPWGPDKITEDGREQLRALGFRV